MTAEQEQLLDELTATTETRRGLEQQVKTIIEQQKVLAKTTRTRRILLPDARD